MSERKHSDLARYAIMIFGMLVSLASTWIGFYFLYNAENQWYFYPGVITCWVGILLGVGITGTQRRLDNEHT